MQFFELLFNNKRKNKDIVFDSFCFIPQSKPESKLGFLYLAGQIQLPDVQRQTIIETRDLLSQLAEIIQKEYYQTAEQTNQPSSEQALKIALDKTNQFLAEKPNPDLSFTALVVTPELKLFLSKMGSLQILLLRQQEVFNIGQDINLGIQPNKSFPNVIEGQLEETDKVLILSKTVLDFFNEQDLFPKIVKVRTKKYLKGFLKRHKKLFKNLSGLCLFILVKKPKKKVFISLPQFSADKSKVDNLFLKLARKILPHSPALQPKLAKSIFAFIVLIIVLILGLLIF